MLAQDANNYSFLISLALMIFVFYFLLIRPQQRRARMQRELMQSLSPGDEIITIGGVFGTITRLDDESVTVEVAPGTEMRFVRNAVARKISPIQERAIEEADEAS